MRSKTTVTCLSFCRFSGDGVRGAVDVLHGVLRLDRRLDAERLQRGRRLAVGLQGIDVLDQVAVRPLTRGVAERHLLVAVRRDGEDLHLQQVVADVLEQTGVLGTADDAGVNLPRLVGLDQLALHLLAVDDHGELVDGGPLGDGEDVGGFEVAVGVVAEGLLDLGEGDLILDGDAHLVVEHGQGRHGLLRGDQQAVAAGRPAPDERHRQQQCECREVTSHGFSLSYRGRRLLTYVDEWGGGGLPGRMSPSPRYSGERGRG